MKPAFSDKPPQSKKLPVVENDEIISYSADVAETFNQLFVAITESFNIRELTEKAVLIAIDRFSNHSSIKEVKDICQNCRLLSFRAFTRQEIETEIANLTSRKATTYKDIPPKMLKSIVVHLLKIFNYDTENLIFPTELKCADVSVLQKGARQLQKISTGQFSITHNIKSICETL